MIGIQLSEAGLDLRERSAAAARLADAASMSRVALARALNNVHRHEDRRAQTNCCDGCHCVSPHSRRFHIEGVGWGCADCADLARTPNRPKGWGRA